MTEQNLPESKRPTADMAQKQAIQYAQDLARVYKAERAKREELEIANQTLGAIFSATPDGLVVLDDELIVRQANPAFADWVEIPVDAILNQPLADVFQAQPLISAIKRLAADERAPADVEFTVSQPAKRAFQTNIVRLHSKTLDGWIVVLHDQTKQKQLENQKSEFVSIAAHELRTPLVPIIASSELLQFALDDVVDEEQREILGDIQEGGQRLLGIVNELLEFAELDRSDLYPSEISEFVLSELITEVASSLQQQADEHEVAVQVTVGEPIDRVVSNPALLRSALHQLVLNGISFNRPGGTVHIEATQDDDKIAIKVIDTGIGISQSDQDTIFAPFFQVEESLTRSVGGLGLGLSIAKGAVAQLGGRLSVESKPGEGSTFAFLLEKKMPLRLASPLEEMEELESRFAATQAQSMAYARDVQTLHSRLRESFISTLAAMVDTLEARDAYTRGHTDRVTNYSLQIARMMDYSRRDLRTMETAGRIHDVGKIGVRDAILNKPGPLTREEYEIMKTHMTIGPNLVAGLDFLKDAAPIAFAHHERWDGKGYPQGLAGKDIPLGGRIMAVADAYDAMTSDRPYRKGMPKEKAMRIFRKGAGTQWDARIVDIFLRSLEEIDDEQ